MRLPAVIVSVAVASVALVGCSTTDESAMIAEPAVAFPTSTVKKAQEKEAKKDAEKSKESSSTKKSSAKKTTTRKTTTKKPAPKKVEQAPAEIVANCVWPKQSAAKEGEEFQRFCDGSWASTTFPGEGDYFWRAKGTDWVSLLPAGTNPNGNPCFSEEQFTGAPEQIRRDVEFCTAR